MSSPTLNGGVDPRNTQLAPVMFLQSPRNDAVPVELKSKIIETYTATGNLTQACRINGVDPRNMRLHYQADPEFRRLIDEARQQICDKAEGHIVEHMSRPQNVIDRLSWLRAYRPGIWNPTKDSHVTVNVKVTEQLSSRAQGYIDTTATDDTTGSPTTKHLDKADKPDGTP